MTPSEPQTAEARLQQEAVETATANLLLEIAFLLPIGTNVRQHPIAKKLEAFKLAIEGRSVLGIVKEPETLGSGLLCPCCNSDGLTSWQNVKTEEVGILCLHCGCEFDVKPGPEESEKGTDDGR